MSDEIASILIMGVTAVFLLFVMLAGARRLRSKLVIWMLISCCCLGALSSIWFVDVNIPLQTSHFRPGGDAAPMWAATIAWVLRVSMILSALVFGRRLVEVNTRGADNV